MLGVVDASFGGGGVRDDVRSLMDLAEMVEDNHRHLLEAKPLGGQKTAVARDYAGFRIHQDRGIEAESRDAAGDLRYVGVGMRPWISRKGNEPIEGRRPRFQAMMEAAHRREFDLVLFWSLDRFSREGVLETLNHLQRLSSYGCGWKAYTEQYLDSCGIFKDAELSILATIAKQERIRIARSVALFL